MKREFLQTLKVGEQTLPKELIDAIMAENGRDIEAAKAAAVKPYGDYDAIVAENRQLKERQAQTIVDGKDAQGWKEAYDLSLAEHQKELFTRDLSAAIMGAGGRNVTAITALLDPQALQNAENRQEALNHALKELKEKEGYLFGSPVPPPYARGTGTQKKETAPTDLAGALREKFERK